MPEADHAVALRCAAAPRITSRLICALDAWRWLHTAPSVAAIVGPLTGACVALSAAIPARAGRTSRDIVGRCAGGDAVQR